MKSLRDLDVVIPHTSGDEYRRRNLLVTLRHYLDMLPEARITVAEQDTQTDLSGFSGVNHVWMKSETGVCNRGRLRNFGAAAGDREWILLVDNDSIINPDLLRSLPDLLSGCFAFFPFNEIRYLGEQETDELTDTAQLHPSMGKILRSAKNFPGLALFLRRREFESVGRYEEFEGWGYEDILLNHKLKLLHGAPSRATGHVPIYHLWHPRSDTREWFGSALYKENAKTAKRIREMKKEQLMAYVEGKTP